MVTDVFWIEDEVEEIKAPELKKRWDAGTAYSDRVDPADDVDRPEAPTMDGASMTRVCPAAEDLTVIMFDPVISTAPEV